MWTRGGLIFAILVAATLSAAGQEQSTETTCIATLRQTVNHLGKIEQQLDSADRACAANAAARRQIDDLNQSLAKANRDLTERQAEVDTLQGELAGASARLKRIDAAADQQVRAALPHEVQADCGEKLDIATVDGVVRLSGSLLKADDALRRAQDAVRGIPGVEVKSELTQLNLCGRSLGDGWSIEVADGTPRRIDLVQVAAVLSRLPEGSDETCRSIGAKLDKLTDLDASERNVFWVRRPAQGGQSVALCSVVDGQWTFVPRQINLTSIQALVVQHSQ